MAEETLTTEHSNVIAPPVGSHAFTGAVWTTLFAVGNKIITAAGQVALAWLLVPEDFGLIAMALAFTSIVSLLMLSGLSDVLVQRQSRFESDAPQVFWLSLIASIVAAGLTALCAPLGAKIFNEPRVAPLILIEALSWPIDGYSAVNNAMLRRDLRFKPLASVQIIAGIAHTGTAVGLAAAGWGVYALAFASVSRRLASMIVICSAAGKRPRGSPIPSQWPALLRPAVWLMLATFFLAIQTSAPSFVLGHFTTDAHQVGLLAWGFGLAVQAVYLLATNLQGVLFPTLARLSAEPERQFEAVNKTVRLVTALLAPVCILQVVLARPVLKLAFKPEWLPAAPVIAWLSFGLLTQPLNMLAGALLKAQGRFNSFAFLTAVQAVVVSATCTAGAINGNAISIGRSLGCALLINGLIAGWVAYREYGHGWRHLFSTTAGAFAVGAVSGTAGWSLKALFESQPFYSAAVPLGAILTIHLLYILWLAPKTFHEIRSRFQS